MVKQFVLLHFTIIWFSYGMELRDTGMYGFLLPPNQIIPTGQEVFHFSYMHPQIPTWQEVESINQLNLKTEYVFCLLQIVVRFGHSTRQWEGR